MGWACVAAMAVQFVAVPLAAPFGVTLPFPSDHLWELVFGMLGLGGLRSYDKTRRPA